MGRNPNGRHTVLIAQVGLAFAMRGRTFLNRLALAALCGLFLHVAAGCGVYQASLYYDIPRPGGGIDNVQIQISETDAVSLVTGLSQDQTYRVTVNGRDATAEERRRILSLVYIPSVLLIPQSYATQRVFSDPFGDPNGIRPRGSIDPPIPDPTLGTRPKS